MDKTSKELVHMEEEKRKSIKYKLTRMIEHEEQGSYIEVPFDMPLETEEFHVSYELAGPEKHETEAPQRCVVDLGVKDAVRARGWSGGARTEFKIGREKATPGYLPGPLTPGAWAVLLGPYKIPKEGCFVTIFVECFLETPRWLKGDLHTHTVHSDGTYTLAEAIEIMEGHGCDFLATTDHNTVSQNLAHPRETNLVLIPGMELTTNMGHSNFLGVVDPVTDFRATEMEHVHSIVAAAREKGAKIVLNHPHCRNCGWLWDFEVDHDWIEVWNGPWREDNQKTLDWWQQKLREGKRIVAIGGSDAHRPNPYVKHSMPTTWVYSKSRTVQGILEAIDFGHVFISYHPEGPTIDLSCGSFMMGDLVGATEHSQQVQCKVDQLRDGDTVKLISEDAVEQEIMISGETSIQTHRLIEGKAFYRIEVWRHFTEVNKTLLAAMSNPLYFRSG
jgi:hypothetical protein